MNNFDFIQFALLIALLSFIGAFFLFIVMLVAVLSPPGDFLGDICESIMRFIM